MEHNLFVLCLGVLVPQIVINVFKFNLITFARNLITTAAPATLFLSSSSVEIISHLVVKLEYQVAVNFGNHNCGTVA